MSPKNVKELEEICKELGTQMRKIGKVFDVRWVASSLKTVRAIWNNYEALYKHFVAMASSTNKNPRSRAKGKGLKVTLGSVNFVLNMGLLFDSLQELSNLSLELQKRDSNIVTADRCIQTYIRVLQSMKIKPKKHYIEARRAAEEKSFRDIDLKNNIKIIQINYEQFLQSLIDNLSRRLLNNSEDIEKVLSCAKVVYTEFWPDPDEMDIRYGENEISFLCEKFQIDESSSLRGMMDYITNPNRFPERLIPVKNCVDSLACGTAECERGFSAMNLIITDLRNNLLIQNVSNLLFIKINGPTLEDFDPKFFLKKWKENHRLATDNRTRKVQRKESDPRKRPMHELLMLKHQ